MSEIKVSIILSGISSGGLPAAKPEPAASIQNPKWESLVEAENQAGFKVKIPTRLPAGELYSHAFYNEPLKSSAFSIPG